VLLILSCIKIPEFAHRCKPFQQDFLFQPISHNDREGYFFCGTSNLWQVERNLKNKMLFWIRYRYSVCLSYNTGDNAIFVFSTLGYADSYNKHI